MANRYKLQVHVGPREELGRIKYGEGDNIHEAAEYIKMSDPELSTCTFAVWLHAGTHHYQDVRPGDFIGWTTGY